MSEKALALSYDPQFPAPVLQAKGEGCLAKEIIKIAQLEGIPIHQNKALTESLIHFHPGQEIPEEYFQVLALVFTSIFDFEAGQLRKKE